MNICCKENGECCILNLHSNILTFGLVFRLKKILKTVPSDVPIALNLENVDYICVEFLEFLKDNSKRRKLSLLGLQSEIFALLNLTNYDNFANIFLSDLDFIKQKRILKTRRFSVLGNF